MRNGRLAPQSVCVCELLTDAIIISICTYNSVAHRCSGGDARRTRHDFANGSHGNCFFFVRPLCGSVRLSAINLDVNGECRVYFITFRLSHSRSTRRFAYLLHSERRHQLAHLRAWMVYIGMQFWKTLVPCMQITTAAHEAARANIWMNYGMDVIKSNSHQNYTRYSHGKCSAWLPYANCTQCIMRYCFADTLQALFVAFRQLDAHK